MLGVPSWYTVAPLCSQGCPDLSCGHTRLQSLPEHAGLSFGGPLHVQAAVPKQHRPPVQLRCSGMSPTWAGGTAVGAELGLEGDREGKASFHKPVRAQLADGKPRGCGMSPSRAGLMSTVQVAASCTPEHTRARDLRAPDRPAPHFPGAAETLLSELKSNLFFFKKKLEGRGEGEREGNPIHLTFEMLNRSRSSLIF